MTEQHVGTGSILVENKLGIVPGTMDGRRPNLCFHHSGYLECAGCGAICSSTPARVRLMRGAAGESVRAR